MRGTAVKVASMQQRSFVGLRPTGDEDAATPTGRSTPNTKHRRQLQTFVADIRIADRVVVPTRDRLLVGEIVGDYEWLADAPEGLHHARSVRWLAAMSRFDLTRPVHLQDPRVVFALRDEPSVAADSDWAAPRRGAARDATPDAARPR